MSRISVVMPIYNAAEFLRESIDDIRKQTFTDWELICVNDGSTDECGQILEEYANADSRIKVFSQVNQGGAVARNLGLSNSNSEYVIFLDADDRFEDDMFEILINELDENPTDVLIFAGDCFDYSTGKVRNGTWLLDEKYLSDEYMSGNYIKKSKKSEILYRITNTTVWNKVFNRYFLINNNIMSQGANAADCLYMVMLALAMADRISVCNKTLIHYRENVPTGQIANVCRNPLGSLEAAIAIRERFQKEGLFPEYEKAYINYVVKFIMNRLKRMGIGFAQQILYTELYMNGFEDIGIFPSNLEILEDENLRAECQKLLYTDYIDYIYEFNNYMKKMINPSGAIYYLPENFPDNVKIAVYGAGNVGKSYFAYLLNSNKHTLIGWFDRKYAECGYPVENPTKLVDRDFDIVIIAIEMATAANSIKNDLIKLGVEESKIFWAEPKAF